MRELNTDVADLLKEDWYGLYTETKRDGRFYDSESVRHPAKMSRQLVNRILDHLYLFQYIRNGSIIVDLMAGIGTTAIEWCRRSKHNRAITIELEKAFVDLQYKNKALCEESCGELRWEIIQGDARKADELLAPLILKTSEKYWKSDDYWCAAVSSPPYADSEIRQLKSSAGKAYEDDGKHARDSFHEVGGDIRHYGRSNGQIGSLPCKDTEYQAAIGIMSPPYGNGVIGKPNQAAVERLKALTQDPNSSLYGRNPDGEWFKAMEQGYINSDGNIDRLPTEYEIPCGILSPPYADMSVTNYGDKENRRGGIGKNYQAGIHPGAGRNTSEQIGYAAIFSPPYEDSLNGDDPDKRGGLFRDPKRRRDASLTATYTGITSPPYEAQSGGHPIAETGPLSDPRLHERHSASKINPATGYAGNVNGQIGVTKGETYASACLDVYRACARAGIARMVLVTKNPTKNGQLKPLDQLTISLMEQAGYRLALRRRAWLWETKAQMTERLGAVPDKYNDKPDNYPIGRISFFKRLHLSKGIPASQWEDVLFFDLA